MNPSDIEAPIPPPTNLQEWSTARLQTLYNDYSESLPHVRSLFGPNHFETITYQNWVKAIKEELDRRGC